MQNFTNIQDQLYSFNIQDDQSWAFSKIVQKISKITQYYGQPVLAFDKRQICSASFARVFEWTFIELHFNIIRNLLCLFFIQWFYNDV